MRRLRPLELARRFEAAAERTMWDCEQFLSADEEQFLEADKDEYRRSRHSSHSEEEHQTTVSALGTIKGIVGWGGGGGGAIRMFANWKMGAGKGLNTEKHVLLYSRVVLIQGIPTRKG